MADSTDLSHRFTFHPPQTEERAQQHRAVRAECHRTAAALAELVPPSRELSLALTKIEEAMMWANAGLARNRDGQA